MDAAAVCGSAWLGFPVHIRQREFDGTVPSIQQSMLHHSLSWRVADVSHAAATFPGDIFR